MIINILAGGPETRLPSLTDKKWQDDVWVGVDRGVLRLLQQNIQPSKAFGDFDSITQNELSFVRERLRSLEISPAEKDEVDLELALNWAVEQNPSLVRIFGATGGRMDHMFGAVQLLYKGLNADIPIQMIDRQNIVSMHLPGCHEVEQDAAYGYISFVPFSEEIRGLTLEGFKYPLTNHIITWGSTLCISNELIQQRGTFSFAAGILMMIRSND
ncbi:thiamine diphosphokinase [Bacillus songklensis]|uniref:Thiamine diphosphokinase n=1 Tax=Bacillus songklensis TaxID=1069116 RepID=A0ABV8AY81_9BACI